MNKGIAFSWEDPKDSQVGQVPPAHQDVEVKGKSEDIQIAAKAVANMVLPHSSGKPEAKSELESIDFENLLSSVSAAPVQDNTDFLNGLSTEVKVKTSAENKKSEGDELLDFLKSDAVESGQQKGVSLPESSKNKAQAPLTIRIADKKTLYHMWMRIFKTGGFFIPKDQLSGRSFKPMDTMMIRVALPDDPTRLSVLNVKMAWETPERAEHRMAAGYGFALEPGDTAEEIKQRAERLLLDIPPNTHSLILF
jgi:Tfp pilus assembly protein PilZ